MTAAASRFRSLARHLLALETDSGNNHAPAGAAAARVVRRLRDHLSRLIGQAGFDAILGRAATLSRRDDARLERLQVGADGVLTGLDGIEPSAAATEAGAVFLATLLGLLASLVGEDLTRRLVARAWPEALVAADDPTREETIE